MSCGFDIRVVTDLERDLLVVEIEFSDGMVFSIFRENGSLCMEVDRAHSGNALDVSTFQQAWSKALQLAETLP